MDGPKKSKRANLSRRDSLQLVLGVAALGMALGKVPAQAKDAKPMSADELSAVEKSIFLKLNKSEQSLYIKLTRVERSGYMKLTNAKEKSEFLKVHAD